MSLITRRSITLSSSYGDLSREELISRIEALEARVHAEPAIEEALRESEARYRTLFESIDEGFCIVRVLFHPDGEAVDYRFLETNPAFVEQTGLHDAVGRWMRDLEPEHEEHWFRTYGRIARTGRPERFINEARQLGRWYDVYAFRVGRPEENRLAILFKDITERKRVEEELREAKGEAERASEPKDQLLSTMSHELRTPLTAVLGLVDLLETEAVGPLNETQKAYVSRIRAASRHLLSIIEDILAFSRSEVGTATPQWVETDVAGIARGVTAMLRSRAEAEGLALRFSGAAEPVVAVTDGGKVRQILTNLVGNALKYTDHGTVEVGLDASREWIELRVRDTGPGIPHDRLEDIFEPFVRLDDSTIREQRGTGLGLAICDRLARLLHGEVTVESTVGEGSTFTLRLPRSRKQGNPQAEGPHPAT